MPGKSIVDHAKLHVNHEVILCMDIKDFFPTITMRRVWGLFKSIGYNKKIARDLAEICTFENTLPQGSPTSPMIANLICWKLDNNFIDFCEKRGFTYSRYADDIVISGPSKLCRNKTQYKRLIKNEGFEINPDKTRVIGRGSSQKVTSLVVNDRVSLGKRKRKLLEAIVYNIEKNGPVFENKLRDPFFKERLYGHLSYAEMVEPSFAKPLKERLNDVDWNDYEILIKSYIQNEQITRSLSKNKKIEIVKINNLGFFSDIPQLPPLTSSEISKLHSILDKLREKCNEHSKSTCIDCLVNQPKPAFKKCIKYIMGHYIENTGGHHHGHEVYDISGDTTYFGELLFVVFLLKSAKMSLPERNSLFVQFFKCARDDIPDIISIVTPGDLDHKLELNIRQVIKDTGKGKKLCLIVRREMERIYTDFINNNP